MRILADFWVDRLERKCQCIGEILTSQRKRRGDHLHDNCDKQAENSHDHRKGDHRIDGV